MAKPKLSFCKHDEDPGAAEAGDPQVEHGTGSEPVKGKVTEKLSKVRKVRAVEPAEALVDKLSMANASGAQNGSALKQGGEQEPIERAGNSLSPVLTDSGVGVRDAEEGQCGQGHITRSREDESEPDEFDTHTNILRLKTEEEMQPGYSSRFVAEQREKYQDGRRRFYKNVSVLPKKKSDEMKKRFRARTRFPKLRTPEDWERVQEETDTANEEAHDAVEKLWANDSDEDDDGRRSKKVKSRK